jgi:CRISPR-associated endoribonuclease Cas6
VLRPLQKEKEGTLMPFSGELVHAACLSWLTREAPEVATWLHDGQKRRLFTCSNLYFAQPMQPLLKAERENIHLPLDPRKTYTIRLTLLLGELFPLFYSALMQFKANAGTTGTPPFIRLGKQLFQLEDILLTNDDPDGWTGFTSLANLIEKAQQVRFGREPSLTLEFASLTAFSRGNSHMGYGTYHVLFPHPQQVFQSLLRRWDDIAPPEFAHVIDKERIEQYLQEDGVIVIDYDIKAHHVHFTTHLQRGFVGTCTYQLRGSNGKTAPDAPLTLWQQLYLLAQLPFYCGVGHKTTMGMGQTRLKV